LVRDALRLARDAGHEVDEATLDGLAARLGGERLLLVDPSSPRAAPSRPATGRARGRRQQRPARTGRRSGPPLEDLDVYELPAALFGRA
ncbi:hypothetical protein ACVU7I_16310, partial [Patulibacter sp. S7RM1-6]